MAEKKVMAAKKMTSLSIAEIEKTIARVTAELHQARRQKVADAQQAVTRARAAVTAATTKVNQLAATGTTTAAIKNRLKKAQTDLAAQQASVADAEESLADAKTALEIAVACAKVRAGESVRTKESAKPARPSAKKTTAAKTAGAVKALTAKTGNTTESIKAAGSKKSVAPEKSTAAKKPNTPKDVKDINTAKGSEQANKSQPVPVQTAAAKPVVKADKKKRSSAAEAATTTPADHKNKVLEKAVKESAKVSQARPSLTLATRKAIAGNEPDAVQTAMEFGDQEKDPVPADVVAVSQAANLRNEELPKPLPVDQDDVAHTTRAYDSAKGAVNSGHASTSVIEPHEYSWPKPEPV